MADTLPPRPEHPDNAADHATPSLWRQRWTQDILPFGTSLALHLGIIALGIATYQAVRMTRPIEQKQLNPVEVAVIGPELPNLPLDPDSPQVPVFEPSVVTPQSHLPHGPSLSPDLPGGKPGQDVERIGPGGKGLPGMPGGSGTGVGIGSGGPLDRGSSLFPNPPRGTNAKVVYVCDASGSMMSKMDILKIELAKSVNHLRPFEGFDVIFFQNDAGNPKHYIDFAPDLVPANADNKKKLDDFLQDIVGRSNTFVIPALQAAFQKSTKPEVIYLLTDGAFEDEGAKAVIAAIDKLNVGHKVSINTILLIGKDLGADELKDATEAMQKIAAENHGTFNSVSLDSLQ